MTDLINVGEIDFEKEVLKAEVPVLADFWASWCGHCTKLAPVLNELAEEFSGKVKIVKVNIDECKSLTQNYGIASLPTLILFKNGQQVEKLTGYSPKADICSKISPHL